MYKKLYTCFAESNFINNVTSSTIVTATDEHTLYAKWTDGAGITYIAYENAPSDNTVNTLTWIICIAVGLLAVVVSVLIIWGGRKRANKKK